MDNFTFDQMCGNLRVHQNLFCHRLVSIDLLREMGKTLTESNRVGLKQFYLAFEHLPWCMCTRLLVVMCS
jgi:hypothetical protein